MATNMENEMETGALKGLCRGPGIQAMLALGPKI